MLEPKKNSRHQRPTSRPRLKHNHVQKLSAKTTRLSRRPNSHHIYLFGQIQTSQTGGQPYSHTAPIKVSECSLIHLLLPTKVENVTKKFYSIVRPRKKHPITRFSDNYRDKETPSGGGGVKQAFVLFRRPPYVQKMFKSTSSTGLA